MVRKVIQAFAAAVHGAIVVHDWYRALLPAKRVPSKMPEELSPKSPVVIVAASRVEADEIAELLGKDYIVVGYFQKTRYDLLRYEA